MTTTEPPITETGVAPWVAPDDAHGEETPPQMHHPAHLAIGWAIVDLSMCAEKERVTLFRTMRIEAHENGTFLSSTDGTIALRAWVPTIEASWKGDNDGPGEHLWSSVVRDPGKRALALTKYAAKIDDADESVGTHVVKLSQGDIDFDALPGLEAPPEVLVELDDSERVTLAGVEGQYPDIGAIVASWAPSPRQTIKGLDTTFTAIGKLAKMHYDTIDLSLGERHVRIVGGFAAATTFEGIASIGNERVEDEAQAPAPTPEPESGLFDDDDDEIVVAELVESTDDDVIDLTDDDADGVA